MTPEQIASWFGLRCLLRLCPCMVTSELGFPVKCLTCGKVRLYMRDDELKHKDGQPRPAPAESLPSIMLR